MNTSDDKNIVHDDELSIRGRRMRRVLAVLVQAVGIAMLRWGIQWVVTWMLS